jgi:myosin heavy subunit
MTPSVPLRTAQVHPPMSRIRRAIEPYKQQIADLERDLRKEKAAHEMTRTMLEARALTTEEEMHRRREAEKHHRMQHLLQVAVRRTLKMELARGWTQWHDVTKHTKINRMRALARFRSHGLFKALRTWRLVCPPRHLTPESLIICQEALERERAAHAKCRAQLVKLREKWETKFEKYREAVQTAATLQSVVRELQAVLKEALDASSWSSCRMVLYHEHLRYVPSAATHGRGGRWRAGLARKKGEIDYEIDCMLIAC